MIGSATFSVDGKYRYHLMREWDSKLGKVCFVMLNPSSANAIDTDPTVSRCINYAKSWGFGGIEVVNLFALVSTNPRILTEVTSAVGPENHRYIEMAANSCEEIVIAWGKIGNLQGRAAEVLEKDFMKNAKCLKLNKDGTPSHPLYLKKILPLSEYLAA